MIKPSSKVSPCLIVGEVAQAHDGSLGLAHAHIDAIAAAGADAVKFQTHIAAAESTPSEPWRVRFSPQDATRYDYWKRMEFTEQQWMGLRTHAKDKGLQFVSSPFSPEAVELLTRVGVDAWKVASGEVNNDVMFNRMASTGQPVWLSTGMSPLSEIEAAVHRVKSQRLPLTLMQCTSTYPCPPEKIGLNMLEEFRTRFGCNVGLSDHSGKIYAGLAAVTLGIQVLEVHVTLSREMFGPDVGSSVTSEELKKLVEGTRAIECMLANPVDKDAMANQLTPLRSLFTKSIVARTDLPPGTILGEQHLALKKPGSGIPPHRLSEILGRTLKRAIPADTLLHEDDLEHQ
jgi:N,N'-diacetyllegionaminate synthase